MGAQAQLQKPGAHARLPLTRLRIAALAHGRAQMDHWRLDEDEISFEDDRLEQLRKQELEAARLHAESAQFYQLARASQERTKNAGPVPTLDLHPTMAEKRRRRDASLPAFKVQKKESPCVVPAAPEPDASVAPAFATTPEDGAVASTLPGMDAYGACSDSD